MNKPAPTAIKRVDQSESLSVGGLTLLKQRQMHSIFMSHFIGNLWKPAISHEDDAFHCRLPMADGSDAELDNLVQAGFDYALPLCLADPYMKHSEHINEEQSKWFREFGRRPDGMLAINPIDKIFEYDKYFGKNIAQERIVYASCIPSGNVLCFSWLKDNYMHLQLNNGFADVWMKYNTQIDVKKYQSPDDVDIDIDEDESEICDSMLVNMDDLAESSLLDLIYNGLIQNSN